MSKAIIVVSFGTTGLEGLEVSEALEEKIRESVNGRYHVCKAFTSSVLSNILSNKCGKVAPRLEEVLFNLSNDGYKGVYTQPLHVTESSEYPNIEKTIKKYDRSFSGITLGNVLMSNKDGSLKEPCNLIVNTMEDNLMKTDNIVLVGHGFRTTDTDAYNILKGVFIEHGYKNVYIGTLEGEIRREDAITELLKDNIKNITSAPVLMLPGNHIKKDIFGECNPRKASIKEHNINVTSSKKALLEYKEIREYCINNIK